MYGDYNEQDDHNAYGDYDRIDNDDDYDHIHDDNEDDENDDSTEDEEKSSSKSETNQSAFEIFYGEPARFGFRFETIIEEVRSIVRTFRKSNANYTLQKYIRMEFHKLKLKKDCKTRWNSICLMLERFYKLRNPIQKSAIDENLKLLLSNCHFKVINELVQALKPIEDTVKVISSQSVNLFETDTAFCTLLTHLKKQNTWVSSALHKRLVVRLSERRTILSDVLEFLVSKNLKSEVHTALKMSASSKKDIMKKLLKYLVN